MIEKLATEYPVQLLCAVLDFPRSSYYYPAHPRDDAALKAALREAADEWPTYGYRRLTVRVRRDKQIVALFPLAQTQMRHVEHLRPDGQVRALTIFVLLTRRNGVDQMKPEKLESLKSKAAKLAEQIRRIEEREREQKERVFLSLARRPGLLKLVPEQIETALEKFAESIAADSATVKAAPAQSQSAETAQTDPRGDEGESVQSSTSGQHKTRGLFGFSN